MSRAERLLDLLQRLRRYRQPVSGAALASEDFRPFRRDVDWLAAHDAPIQPLLDALDFTAGVHLGRNIIGLLAVSDHDLRLIVAAMGAALSD